MNSQLSVEVRRLGGDPADEVWAWLVERGPQGPSFSWGQTRRKPPGYVGLDHLQRIVAEMTETTPDFLSRAHRAAALAIESDWPLLVRRGIQVIAAVGGAPDLPALKALAANPDAEISADARACAFHLKRRGGAA